jgi:hypothetical protein
MSQAELTTVEAQLWSAPVLAAFNSSQSQEGGQNRFGEAENESLLLVLRI